MKPFSLRILYKYLVFLIMSLVFRRIASNIPLFIFPSKFSSNNLYLIQSLKVPNNSRLNRAKCLCVYFTLFEVKDHKVRQLRKNDLYWPHLWRYIPEFNHHQFTLNSNWTRSSAHYRSRALVSTKFIKNTGKQADLHRIHPKTNKSCHI